MPVKKPASGKRHTAPETAPELSSARGPLAERIRVAVASGPALHREVLCQALGAEPTLTIVGSASAEDDIGEVLSKTPAQVLLFDYEALGPNSEGLIGRLRRHAPETRILVLATRSGPETVERVLRAGASGLVGKESGLALVVRNELDREPQRKRDEIRNPFSHRRLALELASEAAVVLQRIPQRALGIGRIAAEQPR